MKNIKFYLFIVLALIQLYIPAQMIWGQESILNEGKAFKFRTAPIDPNDPFRGKYIWLDYEANEYKYSQSKDIEWQREETIFVHIENDDDGFVKVIGVSKEPPSDGTNYVKAIVDYFSNIKNQYPTVHIHYPFDRFYMEESKAYEAELTYQKAQRDSTQIAYGLVYIKDGNAVLENVILNGIPIKEVVKQERANKK